jgi:hypothetical protein
LQGKIQDQVVRIVTHPLIIAIPFAIITIILFPPIFIKSGFELVSFRPADKKGKSTTQYYHDLNLDGVDEEISKFRNAVNQCAVKIVQGNGQLAGQWNLDGTLPAQSCDLLYLDYNNNGIKEVFCLYQREDSVFMAGIDFNVDSMLVFDEIFIDKIWKVNGTTDFSSTLQSYDLNGDGTQEAIIMLAGGYSKQPRSIYAYNFRTNQLSQSPSEGFIIRSIKPYDIDNDGEIELLTNLSSPENIRKNTITPYSDYERWFVVYDKELEFAYGPVKLGDGAGSVQTLIFTDNEREQIIVHDKKQKDNQPNTFYSIDFATEQLTKISLPEKVPEDILIFEYQSEGQRAPAAYDAEEGNVFILDPFSNLAITKELNIGKGLNFIKSVEILHGAESGFVFQKPAQSANQLLFFSSDFRLLYDYTMPHNYSEFKTISFRSISSEKKHLVLQMDEDILELEYVNDNLFYVKRLALYLLIYGFYALIIFFIIKSQQRLMRNYYKKEQALTELKLISIRNQMDPHFTFNAINAIAAAIYKEDKETAYNYFSIFSKLIRSTMLYSDRMTRTLDEEIDFTIKYLKIEKFRFRDKFNFKLDIEDDVNLSMEVPRMVIQTYAESAVTNGLMHREEGGILHIKVSNKSDKLIVTFEDNGVGIEECKKLNKEKAFKSVKIMEEFIRLFNDLNNTNVTWKMEELNLSKEFPGAKVVVEVPKKKFYSRT